MGSIECITSPQEFWKIINQKLPLIKMNYYSTANGRGSLVEKEFIEIISKIKGIYQSTKDKKYLNLKNEAMQAYSRMIFNVKLDTHYGK